MIYYSLYGFNEGYEEFVRNIRCSEEYKDLDNNTNLPLAIFILCGTAAGFIK